MGCVTQNKSLAVSVLDSASNTKDRLFTLSSSQFLQYVSVLHPFSGVAYQTPHMSGIYITTHNSSKSQL